MKKVLVVCGYVTRSNKTFSFSSPLYLNKQRQNTLLRHPRNHVRPRQKADQTRTDAAPEYRDGADEDEDEGERVAAEVRFFLGRVEVEHGDHFEVVVDGDEGGQCPQQGQQGVTRLDGAGEDVKLAQKTDGRGESGEREHEDAQAHGDERVVVRQPFEFIVGDGGVVPAVDVAEDAEGTDGAEHVGDEVEEDGRCRRTTQFPGRSEADEQVAAVHDGRGRQHTDNVLLNDGDERTRQQGDNGS